jgi:hypothetical protein
MVGRRGNKTPAPPAGCMAERLRLFMESRGSGSRQHANKTRNTTAANEGSKTLREELAAFADGLFVSELQSLGGLKPTLRRWGPLGSFTPPRGL